MRVKSVSKPGLIKASTLLFSMTMAGNLCNYLFHAIASRGLGPMDYGALVTMLAIITVMVIPTQALQVVFAKEVALDELTHQYGRMAALMITVSRQLFLLGGVIFLALVLISPWLASFFHLKNNWPIIMAAIAIWVTFLLPIVRSIFQGLQQFHHLGTNILIDGVARLAFGLLLIYLISWGVNGAVLAAALSGIVTIVIGLWPLRWLAKHRQDMKQPVYLQEMYQYSLPVLIGFTAFALLSNVDVMLVKHFFEAKQAGLYSAASIVGKAFLFLPLAIAQVMFPKVTIEQAKELPTLSLLHKSMALSAGALLAGAAVVWMVPQLIIMTLFGQKFIEPQTLFLVRAFALMMLPLAMVYLMLYYSLAIKLFTFLIILIIDIPLLILAINFMHQDFTQLIMLIGCNHAIIGIIAYMLIQGGKHG